MVVRGKEAMIGCVPLVTNKHKPDLRLPTSFDTTLKPLTRTLSRPKYHIPLDHLFMVDRLTSSECTVDVETLCIKSLGLRTREEKTSPGIINLEAISENSNCIFIYQEMKRSLL